MSFITQYQAMFGGSTEIEALGELKKAHHQVQLCAAAADPRLPASALGYISQVKNAESIAVAADAAAQIRRFIPEFMLGVI